MCPCQEAQVHMNRMQGSLFGRLALQCVATDLVWLNLFILQLISKVGRGKEELPNAVLCDSYLPEEGERLRKSSI
jgi:hypothetical protein